MRLDVAPHQERGKTAQMQCAFFKSFHIIIIGKQILALYKAYALEDFNRYQHI